MFDERSRLQNLAYQRLIDNEQLEFSCRSCSAPTHGARFCDDNCEAEYVTQLCRKLCSTPESTQPPG